MGLYYNQTITDILFQLIKDNHFDIFFIQEIYNITKANEIASKYDYI